MHVLFSDTDHMTKMIAFGTYTLTRQAGIVKNMEDHTEFRAEVKPAVHCERAHAGTHGYLVPELFTGRSHIGLPASVQIIQSNVTRSVHISAFRCFFLEDVIVQQEEYHLEKSL